MRPLDKSKVRGMRADSLDLRQKVVAAVERGDSTIEEVASTFGIGQTFVKKMLRQHRETGDLSPRPHGGGHAPRLSARHCAITSQSEPQSLSAARPSAAPSHVSASRVKKNAGGE
jgi:transposase